MRVPTGESILTLLELVTRSVVIDSGTVFKLARILLDTAGMTGYVARV